MNELKNKYKRYIISIVVVYFFIIYMISMVENKLVDGKTVQIFMIFAILLSLFIYVLFKDKTNNNLVHLILILGIIMRIGYCLYNGIYNRAHDIGGFTDYESASKGSYLGYLVFKHMLPPDYVNQLYHPPFSYLFSALSCYIGSTLVNSNDVYVIGNFAKASNCLGSCLIVTLVPVLCRELSFSKKATIMASTFTAFCPAMYFVSGSINEDAWCCFFVLFEILFTVKWSKESSFINALILSLAYGFGIQDSLICILPAIYTLTVVIFKIRLESWKKIVKQLLLFFLVSLPIGMWNYIRNLVLFGIPFTYTNKQPIGNWIWTGDKSMFYRFICFDFVNMSDSPYVDPDIVFNLPLTFLKTELFDEYSFNINSFVPYVLLYVDILLTAYLIFVGIYYGSDLIKNKNYLIICMLGAEIGIFVIYCYAKEPFACTMCARYYLALTVIKGILIGYVTENIDCGPFLTKSVNYVISGMLILWSATSIAMFCFI